MRMRIGFVSTLLAVGVAVAVAASGAAADTFTYEGSEQTFAVPANVTGIHVVAVGAQGSFLGVSDGGSGGQLTADVPLPPGTSTLYVEVGGTGSQGEDSPGESGGWNGGGDGGQGGGGASDIRTVSCSTSCATGGSTASLNSRLAVAGGGGGAGVGADGGSSGEPGADNFLDGGGGGTLSAGGSTEPAAEVTQDCQFVLDQDGEAGSDGGFGVGGPGAYLFLTGEVKSGGGGGGWYGGGGGPQCYDSGAVATDPSGAGGGGSSAAPTSPDATVVNADTVDPAEVIITAPVPTAATTPTVAGGLTVGDVLSVIHAQWSTPVPLTGYTYQWERCNASGAACTAIHGATAQTYTLEPGDLGGTIRVQETAENLYGSSAAAATSAATGVVGEPPVSTARPSISGVTTEGQVLLETHGTWTNGPITGYDYQWERCRGGSCTAITGAVNQFYTLTPADVGSAIEVREAAANAYGTSAPMTSAATSTVQPPPTAPPVATAPTAPPVATSFIVLGSPSASATGLSISVLCRAAVGSICRGSARLTTLERLSGGKILALLASAKRHSKRVLVGSKSFTLAAGAQKAIIVPLNGLGHKLLARFHRIPATLTIALLNTTPPTNIAARTTIKPKRNGHKHRR